MVFRTLCLPVLALLFASCSKPNVVPNKPDDEIETGVVIPYKLGTTDKTISTQGCDLVVKDSQTPNSFLIHLNVMEASALLELPPGHFQITKMNCPYQRSWNFEPGAFPSFSVVLGQVSLLGPFKITITEEPGNLNYGRLAGEEAFDILSKVYNKMGVRIRAKLASGVTGISLSSWLFQKSKKSASWLITPLDPKDRAVRDTASPDFQACLNAESKLNWLWVGEFKATSYFDGGKHQKTEIEKTTTSFTSAFGECVVKKLQEFKPAYSGKVRYDLTI